MCRLTSKTIYRVLGAPNIRHRRDAATGDLLRRLLSLDCIVGREGRHWLPTEPEKVAAFAGLGIARAILPKRVYGQPGRARTVRYFGWKMPLAFDGASALFVYVDAEGETYAELLSWGAQHAPLWSALKQRGIRVEAAVASASAERLAGARPVLDRWLSRGLGKASGLAPAERAELRLLERAAPLSTWCSWSGSAGSRRRSNGSRGCGERRLREARHTCASTPRGCGARTWPARGRRRDRAFDSRRAGSRPGENFTRAVAVQGCYANIHPP